MEYAPWADARPYDGGFRYNCMMLQVQIGPLFFFSISFMIQLMLEDSGSPQATSLDFNINDETCEVIVCNDSIHVDC